MKVSVGQYSISHLLLLFPFSALVIWFLKYLWSQRFLDESVNFICSFFS